MNNTNATNDHPTIPSPAELEEIKEKVLRAGVSAADAQMIALDTVGEKIAKKATVHIDRPLRNIVTAGDLVYTKGMLFNCGERGIFTIDKEDIIKLAKIFQREKIQDSSIQDSEGIDHLALAKEILTPVEQSNVVQVLDGTDHPDFSLFPGNNAESLRITIHYIEVNDLKETAPWSAIWNLWKCVEALGKEK